MLTERTVVNVWADLLKQLAPTRHQTISAHSNRDTL